MTKSLDLYIILNPLSVSFSIFSVTLKHEFLPFFTLVELADQNQGLQIATLVVWYLPSWHDAKLEYLVNQVEFLQNTIKTGSKLTDAAVLKIIA